MWRVNYLLKCFFTLMLNVVKELCRFWFCVESTLPDCIRYDHYKDYSGEQDPQEGYDPDEDPYEIQRRADWDNYNKQQEAQIQRWREENPGEDPFVEYPFSVE